MEKKEFYFWKKKIISAVRFGRKNKTKNYYIVQSKIFTNIFFLPSKADSALFLLTIINKVSTAVKRKIRSSGCTLVACFPLFQSRQSSSYSAHKHVRACIGIYLWSIECKEGNSMHNEVLITVLITLTKPLSIYLETNTAINAVPLLCRSTFTFWNKNNPNFPFKCKPENDN